LSSYNTPIHQRRSHVHYLSATQQEKKKENTWFLKTDVNQFRTACSLSKKKQGKSSVNGLMSKEAGWTGRVIRISSEIGSVLKTGRKIKTKWYRLFYRPMETEEIRFAVIVGRRLGNAVRRNRAKRRFRELLRKEIPRHAGGVDIILIPEPASIDEDIHILREALNTTFIHSMDMPR